MVKTHFEQDRTNDNVYRYNRINKDSAEEVIVNTSKGLSIDYYHYMEGYTANWHATSYYINGRELQRQGMPKCDISNDSFADTFTSNEEALKVKMEGVLENGVYPYHPPMSISLPRKEGIANTKLFIYPTDGKLTCVKLTWSLDEMAFPIKIQYQVIDFDEASSLLRYNGISFDTPIDHLTDVIHARDYSGIVGLCRKMHNKFNALKTDIADSFTNLFKADEER